MSSIVDPAIIVGDDEDARRRETMAAGQPPRDSPEVCTLSNAQRVNDGAEVFIIVVDFVIAVGLVSEAMAEQKLRFVVMTTLGRS